MNEVRSFVDHFKLEIAPSQPKPAYMEYGNDSHQN